MSSSAGTNTSGRILLVDDDPRLLNGLYRAHSERYILVRASSAAEGLTQIRENGPFGVVVADEEMPVQGGAEFLREVAAMAPHVTRVVITDRTDAHEVVELAHRADAFRVLVRPFSADQFVEFMTAALAECSRWRARVDAVGETVHGAIQALVEAMALVHGPAFSRSVRIRQIVQHLASELRLEGTWRFEAAALLSQLGSMTLAPELVEKFVRGEKLSEAEKRLWRRHPGIAKELIGTIPALREVAEMVANQDATEMALSSKKDAISIGSRLLLLAGAFDRLMGQGKKRWEAVDTLRKEHKPEWVAKLSSLNVPDRTPAVRELALVQLRLGMVLDGALRNDKGRMLVPRGKEVTPDMLERLRNYAQFGSVEEPIRVRVPVTAPHVPS